MTVPRRGAREANGLNFEKAICGEKLAVKNSGLRCRREQQHCADSARRVVSWKYDVGDRCRQIV